MTKYICNVLYILSNKINESNKKNEKNVTLL